MGILPQIEYGGQTTPNISSQAPGQAFRELGGAMSSILAEAGKQKVQSETLAATAALQEQLDAITMDIQKSPAIPAADVRAVLGETVPSYIEKELTREVPDPVTGEMQREDNPAVPMDVVAGAIYDKRARAALLSAQSKITAPGWQAAFRDSAGEHIQSRKMGIAKLQLKAMQDGQVAATLDAVKKLVNAGNFDLAETAVDTSLVLDPREKVQARDFVQVERQVAPVRDALVSEDPAVIKSELDRLRTSDAAKELIPSDRRKALIVQLEQRSDRFDAIGIAQEALVAGSVPGSQVLDEAKVFGALESKLSGKGPGVQHEARTLTKARISDFNEVRKTRTAGVFAEALQAFQAPGRDGKPRNRVAFIPPEVASYLRDPANGKEAADLWKSLLDAERSDIRGDREMRALPTEENYRQYAALVKDMQDNPGKYRAMPGERFASETYGKLGPLVTQGMSLYKSVNEPKPDQRHLTGDERKAMLEALPRDYRADSKTKPDSVKGQVWSEMEKRLGERKETYLDGKPGPVPQALVKEWVAEETAKVTVKGGALFGLKDRQVPKVEAETNPDFKGKEIVGGPKKAGKVKVRRKSDGMIGTVSNPDPAVYEVIK